MRVAVLTAVMLLFSTAAFAGFDVEKAIKRRAARFNEQVAPTLKAAPRPPEPEVVVVEPGRREPSDTGEQMVRLQKENAQLRETNAQLAEERKVTYEEDEALLEAHKTVESWRNLLGGGFAVTFAGSLVGIFKWLSGGTRRRLENDLLKAQIDAVRAGGEKSAKP